MRSVRKIVVFVKQVTDTSVPARMTNDGTLDRASLPARLNPDDLGALELALAVRERIGGTVTAISMGPDRAEEVLREVMARGADEAILLSDRRYAGADTLATACALAAAARRVGADLLFAGRQSIDGDTAHVGPQVAEELGLPQITGVEALIDCDEQSITVRRQMDEAAEVLRVPLPALFTVSGTLVCRPENIHRLLRQRRVAIPRWTAEMLDVDPARLGASGSATRVIASEHIVTAERANQHHGNDEASLHALITTLADKHLIF